MLKMCFSLKTVWHAMVFKKWICLKEKGQTYLRYMLMLWTGPISQMAQVINIYWVLYIRMHIVLAQNTFFLYFFILIQYFFLIKVRWGDNGQQNYTGLKWTILQYNSFRGRQYNTISPDEATETRKDWQ